MNLNDFGGRRRCEDNDHILHIYTGSISEGTIYCPIPAEKNSTAVEVISSLINRLQLDKTKCYVLAEVKECGEEWILNPSDCPVQRMLMWPRMALENKLSEEDYRFLLREKNLDGSIHYGNLQSWLHVTEERRRMVERGFLPQPQQKDYDDLCNLPILNEKTLLENLRNRFKKGKIYTYVGNILIAINPFKFLPIYNPKYVKMYDNHEMGKLEPHIYAVADVAYHAMLQRKKNQCIVISGESGSGKTQSTNFLIHHLTTLSQKGFASGIEHIILGAGPVLEAFGNAKTAHNNNSSRFGKFIQVNYQENGTVRGAYVEKYLLEKSRLVYQEYNERNYHVFYYMLAGANEEERAAFHLKQPEEYRYLNQMTKKPLRQSWDDYYTDSEPVSTSTQQDCSIDGEDLKHDFKRLQLAMEMVGFLAMTRRKIFSLLSAILHLGNISYKKKTYRDDSIDICNPEVLSIVSELLEVKEDMLFEALVSRKTVTAGEKLILPYKQAEAVTVRDSLAKSLYSALFDWIVFRINHALLDTKDLEESSKTLSIGVLDIFGFEDYQSNNFEQFCINFANERLQHYFNQHIFHLEQEEYRSEGISWSNIDYIDNSDCINLISKKPKGLFYLLDEESNFPQATNQTLLDKFKFQHEGSSCIEFPAVMEPAFIINHYAGKVKYGVKDFREKNTDHMRPDIVALLRSSNSAFICGLIGIDPVAVFRWAILRAFFRALIAFREARERGIQKKIGNDDAVPSVNLKNMDSINFLQHPVHQRSLQILQTCKAAKYSMTRKSPRSPLSDLQGVYSQGSTFAIDWNGTTVSRENKLSTSIPFLDRQGIFINSRSSKLLERAHGLLMLKYKFSKSKPTLPKSLLSVKSLKHLINLTLQDQSTKSLLRLHTKKKPPSISAQFQVSLNKLMETLFKSEPHFVKCIWSNAEKLPLRFSDSLVLRQLQYTGMLETVRIRQSGYSCKYSFQDFVDHFHILLQRDTVPSKYNIEDFFKKIKLNPDNYQVGKTMVFLKEGERQHLQDLLHQEVLHRIRRLQQWFRTWLLRQHFLRLRQAAIILQRSWRNYLSRKRGEGRDVGTDPLVVNSAASVLQAAWRAYWGRRQYLQMRAAASIIQETWREYHRRRHAAATCIQAGWRGYWQSKSYKEQRSKIILLQAACRGFRARQSYKVLKQQLKETKLENGLTLKESTPEIGGSDPSKWEDGLFEERMKTVEEYKFGVENTRSCHSDSVDISEDLPSKLQEKDLSQSSMDLKEDVTVRQRHKSLDDFSVKKVGRAKRESRRMRELEQAIFSLELLKFRGGISPPGDSRWSAEMISKGPPSSPGSPETESWYQDNRKLPKSKLGSAFSVEGDLEISSPKAQKALPPDSKFDAQENVPMISDKNSNISLRQRTPSSLKFLESLALRGRPAWDSQTITSKPQPMKLPIFFIPPQESAKAGHELGASSLHNRGIISQEKPGRASEKTSQHSAAEGRRVGTPVPLPEGPAEQGKEKERKVQLQSEKEMTGQIHQQREQKPIEDFEMPSKRVPEKPQCLILQVTNKDEQNVPGPLSGTIKDLTVSPKESIPDQAVLKGPPTTLFFEGKLSQSQSPVKTNGQNTKVNVASKELRCQEETPKVHSGTPKDHLGLPCKEFLSHGDNQMHSRVDIPRKPVKLIEPIKNQVARPAHKKKARMARTRSDFLTRGTFADGEGDTEEEDSDDFIEPLLPPHQASHPEPGPSAFLGQAYHSDSEMIFQRFASAKDQAMQQKTMSQGDITRKVSIPDGRPQKAKMKFWTKGKHGDKKASREKLTSKSELLISSMDPQPGCSYPNESSTDPELGYLYATHHYPEGIGRHNPASPKNQSKKEFKENKDPSPKEKHKRSEEKKYGAEESIQWQNDTVSIITKASDLKNMEEFLLRKINELDNKDNKAATFVDVMFKNALKEFRQNIFSSYSSALATNEAKSIRYRDLYALFEQILEKIRRAEQLDCSESSPVKVWINTFKVFLDEYVVEFNLLDSMIVKIPRPIRKKWRKKEIDNVEEHNGHLFKLTQYGIPTYCEFCSSLIWIMDRASVCKLCKFACHKKCYLKTTTKCSKKNFLELSSRQFGVELFRLTNEEQTVPLMVEKLTSYIEMHGLYIEGIYRKSGSNLKVKKLCQDLDADIDNVNLDDYDIHVIASVFKQWLRELPNPLMTFELYEEFLKAMGLQKRREAIHGIYSVINQLSRSHLSTLERLIFHLVRIAQREETNLMSANALAIVFAPCILRGPDTLDPLQSIRDIGKTTTCVEMIVLEQMNKYKTRLKDINSLEFAENKAKTNLSLLRSMGKGPVCKENCPNPSSLMEAQLSSIYEISEETMSDEEAMEIDIPEEQEKAIYREAKVLTEQIESLQKEKEDLTFEMLALEPRLSEDETLDSEASVGTADSSENLNVHCDRPEKTLILDTMKSSKSESNKLQKLLKKQRKLADSLDSAGATHTARSATSSHVPQKCASKSPFPRRAAAEETAESQLTVQGSLSQARAPESWPWVISQGAYCSAKGKEKLNKLKKSPQKTKALPKDVLRADPKRTVHPGYGRAQPELVDEHHEYMV
ncbi:unconventional myosin-IXa isoform X2 [Macrotis lagotis]|uniref:unconventional myosin-IXa isoform X2 n=1 Tax=Macrotis lagotis TaxID=92651 RepID=UPI003D694750